MWKQCKICSETHRTEDQSTKSKKTVKPDQSTLIVKELLSEKEEL